jgi:hypothetical protein
LEPHHASAQKSRTAKEARNLKKRKTNVEIARKKKGLIKTKRIETYENRVNTYPSFGLPNGFHFVPAGELLSTTALGVRHFCPSGDGGIECVHAVIRGYIFLLLTVL